MYINRLSKLIPAALLAAAAVCSACHKALMPGCGSRAALPVHAPAVAAGGGHCSIKAAAGTGIAQEDGIETAYRSSFPYLFQAIP